MSTLVSDDFAAGVRLASALCAGDVDAAPSRLGRLLALLTEAMQTDCGKVRTQGATLPAVAQSAEHLRALSLFVAGAASTLRDATGRAVDITTDDGGE